MSLTNRQGEHPLCPDHLQRVKDENQHARLESSNPNRKSNMEGKGMNPSPLQQKKAFEGGVN